MPGPGTGVPLPEAPPPPGVEIRPARSADAREILRLFDAVATEERYIRTEEVSEDIREARRRLRRTWTAEHANLVAAANGQVIGNLGISREDHPVTRHVATLGMSVSREWRGRGVGSALLAEAFRWARWAGVEKVALTVYPHNQVALGLYRKFGFVEEGRLSGHSKKAHGYEDEVVMGRWL